MTPKVLALGIATVGALTMLATPAAAGKAAQWDWQTHVALEWNAASADCGYPRSAELGDGTGRALQHRVSEGPDLGQRHAPALARLLVELEPGVAGRALRIDGALVELGGTFTFWG